MISLETFNICKYLRSIATCFVIITIKYISWQRKRFIYMRLTLVCINYHIALEYDTSEGALVNFLQKFSLTTQHCQSVILCKGCLLLPSLRSRSHENKMSAKAQTNTLLFFLLTRRIFIFVPTYMYPYT